jgi:FtsH-binding integral membrane protein
MYRFSLSARGQLQYTKYSFVIRSISGRFIVRDFTSSHNPAKLRWFEQKRLFFSSNENKKQKSALMPDKHESNPFTVDSPQKFIKNSGENLIKDSGLRAYCGEVYGDVVKYLGVTACTGAITSIGVFTFLPSISMTMPGFGVFAMGTWLFCAGGSIYQAYQISRSHKTLEERKGHAYKMHAFMGVTIAPSLFLFQQFIPHALIATAALTAGPIVVALKTPSEAFLPYGTALYSCLGGLVGVGFLSLFFPSLHSIDMYGGIILFTLYNAYDTHVMITDYKNGIRDAVSHATNYSLNIINLFIRLLEFFARMQQNKSK